MKHPRLLAALVAAASSITLAGQVSPPPATAAPEPPPAAARAEAPYVELVVPRRQVEESSGKRVYSDLGVRLVARGASLELFGRRTSYAELPVATATLGERVATLPDDAMTTFRGLDGFLRYDVQPVNRAGEPTGEPFRVRRAGCIGQEAERVSPDADAFSPYPRSCSYNPYALGSVQGIQEGWAASVANPYTTLPLPHGRYDVVVSLRPAVARALGVPAGGTQQTSRVVVRDYGDHGHGFPLPVESSRTPARSAVPSSAPGARPTAERQPPTTSGPVPDLRSLPAWGIRMSGNGRFLQFSATVWNGGDSPLVVDGFRRPHQRLMDGYQYFFDADGEQVGYQPVGTFEWDEKPTHQHWHFRDFATYTLLRADQSRVVRSRKEAFCLANTDAVDLTGPGADWDVYDEDLSTSCGERDSRSIREVLASGWGDTYAQFRAGQSFPIADLPNGVYYIETHANPAGNLVESDETNNVALRRIVLGGTPEERTVRVPKVGIVEEDERY